MTAPDPLDPLREILDPEFREEARREEQVTTLRQRFQEVIDIHVAQGAAGAADRTGHFTIDGAAWYKVTPGQWRELMTLAPEDIRELNGENPLPRPPAPGGSEQQATAPGPDRRRRPGAAVMSSPASQPRPEEYLGVPLTRNQALAGLAHLGYPEPAARMAVDHAPWTRPEDGASFLAAHQVTAGRDEPDGTYVIRPAVPVRHHHARAEIRSRMRPQPPDPAGPLTAEQAVTALKQLGYAESAALQAVGNAATSTWPGYQVLEHHQVTRGNDGFRIGPHPPLISGADQAVSGLTAETAVARLRQFGYAGNAARHAVEVAGAPGQGFRYIIADHLVTCDYGRTGTFRIEPYPPPELLPLSQNQALDYLTRSLAQPYTQREAVNAVSGALACEDGVYRFLARHDVACVIAGGVHQGYVITPKTVDPDLALQSAPGSPASEAVTVQLNELPRPDRDHLETLLSGLVSLPVFADAAAEATRAHARHGENSMAGDRYTSVQRLSILAEEGCEEVSEAAVGWALDLLIRNGQLSGVIGAIAHELNSDIQSDGSSGPGVGEGRPEHLYTELIQTAAMALTWAQRIRELLARRRGMTLEQAASFYEDDEDPAAVFADFDAGPHGVTMSPGDAAGTEDPASEEAGA
jgi:hypothetical protein